MKIIKTSPADEHFALFKELPSRLYAADSPRHRQAESFHGEHLHACYVGLSAEGAPLSRAALFFPPELRHQGQLAACLGYYECVADEDWAQTFIGAIAEEARQMGLSLLIGPMDGSTWDNYRFSLHHQHPPFLLEPYHHLYYNAHFSAAGFQLLARYTSSLDTDMQHDEPAVLALDQKFAQAGVRIRHIDMGQYEAELQQLYPFISGAFSRNFLYTPIRWESFRDKYLAAAHLMEAEYVLLAEDAQGELLGFIFSYPDRYNSHEKSLVVKTIARHPAPAWAGLGQVLANRIVRLAKSQGYTSVVHAFMIEAGSSTGISRQFMGSVYKNYALYQLQL